MTAVPRALDNNGNHLKSQDVSVQHRVAIDNLITVYRFVCTRYLLDVLALGTLPTLLSILHDVQGSYSDLPAEPSGGAFIVFGDGHGIDRQDKTRGSLLFPLSISV
jgi:hypothetical protein